MARFGIILILAFFCLVNDAYSMGKKPEQAQEPAVAPEVAPSQEVEIITPERPSKPEVEIATPTPSDVDTLPEGSAASFGPEAQSASHIKDIQLALRNAGFDPGPIDGIMGRKTKRAVREFQAANNLKVDGKVGPKTWAALQGYLGAASGGQKGEAQ